MKKNKKNIEIKSIVLLIVYFLWLLLLNLPIKNGIGAVEYLYSFLEALAFLVILFILYKNDFYSDSKKINKRCISVIIKSTLMILIIMLVSNIFSIGLLKNNVVSSLNDNNILSIKTGNLLQIINLFIFYPIIEEVIFRLNLRKIIKEDIFFMAFSTISLGVIYITFQGLSINAVISSIPYILVNLYLSYIYVKNDNIYINFITKILYNFIILFLWSI